MEDLRRRLADRRDDGLRGGGGGGGGGADGEEEARALMEQGEPQARTHADQCCVLTSRYF